MKRTCKKDGNKLLCDRTRATGFKLKEDLDEIWGISFFTKRVVKTLAQVAWRSCECPVPGNIQGWAGLWAVDAVEDIPAHCRVVGLDGLQRSLLTQTILWLWFTEWRRQNRKSTKTWHKLLQKQCQHKNYHLRATNFWFSKSTCQRKVTEWIQICGCPQELCLSFQRCQHTDTRD